MLLAALLAASAAPALAQVAATVQGVQMPAWVERDGRRTPLLPGMELKAGDQVHTGGGSRLVIKLSEGSLVKLGQNGTLRFTELGAGREFLKAVLGVLRGAFRFTTDVATKTRQREVSIGVSQVVAGIRGTDLWGRSVAGNEIVCLIEGKVEIAAGGEPPLTMDQPLQFYRRVQGVTQPVGQVDRAQLEHWAHETEIEAGKGAARRGGRFSALLATLEDQGSALALYDRLRDAGYPAGISPVKEGDRIVYRVRIGQLPSRAEAQALTNQLRGRY